MKRIIPFVLAVTFLAMVLSAPLLAEDPPATPPPPPADPAAAGAAPAAAPATPPAAPAAAAAPAPAAPIVDEMKIIVDDKATTNGQIQFRFMPEGGTAVVVSVTVMKGMKKQAVCEDIAKELAVALGEKYKVDHYDPDKVKVSGKSGAKFSLSIASQSAAGLSIRLK